MKTTHIILDEGTNSKLVQVDLIPDNDEDKRLLNTPTEAEKAQLGDHMIFYLQDIFPQFAAPKMTNESGFPRRAVFKIIFVG